MNVPERDLYIKRAIRAFESLQTAIYEAGGGPIELRQLEEMNAADWFLQLARNNIHFVYEKPND